MLPRKLEKVETPKTSGGSKRTWNHKHSVRDFQFGHNMFLLLASLFPEKFRLCAKTQGRKKDVVYNMSGFVSFKRTQSWMDINKNTET